ncbi:uncharacterized protein LOC127144394 [Cucumis melo]|uniref:Uncharacterized protein LOC127144394 n=1 Tax=Cucumis melo TaxID=3656 RepID=A0ABM3KEQ0_CUCME|nr:uncharacterized protein LOC127144394 [Cucumis melo]
MAWYLHIGCIQVAIKPLFKTGLDVPIYVALRDKRHLNFSSSLLGIVQSNLDNGPVYFTCKPGFTIALQDKNIYDVLCLDVRAKGLRLKNGTYPFSVMYILYYKMMYTNASPKALGVSPKNYTMLMKVNLERSSMMVPKLLDWSELTRNPIWSIEHATIPRTRQSSTTQITEYDDGHVEVQFQEESHQPPIREIYSGWSSVSEYRPTTR